MFRKPLGSILAALLVAGSMLCTTSCGSSSTKIRFAHVLFTGVVGGVDVLIDNRVVVTNLAYGAGGNYLCVSGGSHTLEIRPTGNTNSSSDIINTTESIHSGSQYTAVLDFANGGANLDLYTDQNTAPTTGNASLRVIHASNYLGFADVYAVAPNTGIGGLSPQLSNLQFQNAKYLTLSAGSYEVFVTSAGTQAIQIQTGTSLPALNSQQIKTMILYDTSPFYFLLNDLN